MKRLSIRKRLSFMALVGALIFCLGHSSIVSAQDERDPQLNRPTEKDLAIEEPPLNSQPGLQKSALELTDNNSRSRHSGFLIGRKMNLKGGASSTAPASDEGWQLEIKPYLWLSALDGTLRARNTTANVEASASDLVGMLDFAAAAQVEAIKGKWRLMFDENYVNLGTNGTGPIGLISVEVEPTLNIFEFGGSYMALSVPNKSATATEPLPPVFTAEVLGGGRFFHLGLSLEPSVGSPAEGSRNFVGWFVGNRFKFTTHKSFSLIGKYTVGGSGAGSNTAWSAEGLVDLSFKKGFSMWGGYRVLGMNTDRPENTVGFNGQLRGLILGATLYR